MRLVASQPHEAFPYLAVGTDRLTSAVRSPTLNKVIGLAYLPVSRTVAGSRSQIRIDGGRMAEAEVVPTPFYDPDNKRQEM